MNTSKKHQTRQLYINASLDLISEQGVENLTLRKVAKSLDVTPMAMYKHFSNKDELLSAALDEFIARSDVIPQEDLPWQQWLSYVANAMLRALSLEASWLTVLGSFQIGPEAISVSKQIIKKLVREGFTPRQAVSAYHNIILLLTGAASMNIALKPYQNITVPKAILEEMNANDIPEDFHQIFIANSIQEGLGNIIVGLEQKLALNL